jgi:hypothetical protein
MQGRIFESGAGRPVRQRGAARSDFVGRTFLENVRAARSGGQDVRDPSPTIKLYLTCLDVPDRLSIDSAIPFRDRKKRHFGISCAEASVLVEFDQGFPG